MTIYYLIMSCIKKAFTATLLIFNYLFCTISCLHYIQACSISHLFNYIVYFLLLFFCNVLSRGCCGAQISPFVGQTDSDSMSVSVLFCLRCNINLEAAKTLSMPEHNFNFIHDFKEMSVFPKMNIDHTFYPCKTARSMWAGFDVTWLHCLVVIKGGASSFMS